MKVNVELSGGLELLFEKKQRFTFEFEDGKGLNMKFLIFWMRDNHCKERADLFVTDSDIRPGILVLINEADWELEDRLEYVLQDGDSIAFISTLHGG